MTQPKYIPGVCNIGPAERVKRRQAGIAATVITIILLAILIASDVSRFWRLILILPAAAAASGFLQDAFHFCAGFGMSGLYNVLHTAGTTDTVDSAEFRRKDRHKALTIVGLSALCGVVFVGISLLI